MSGLLSKIDHTYVGDVITTRWKTVASLGPTGSPAYFLIPKVPITI